MYHITRSISHFSNFSLVNYGRDRACALLHSATRHLHCIICPAVPISSALHASPSPYAGRAGLQRATRLPLAICRSRRSTALLDASLSPYIGHVGLQRDARPSPYVGRTGLQRIACLPLAFGFPAHRRHVPQQSTVPLHSVATR